MNPDEMDRAMERFNAGEPLPTVNAQDLETMWRIWQDPELKERTSIAIGFDYAVACGLNPAAFEGGGFVAMSLRQMLLTSLAERGVLNDYRDESCFRAEVFRAAATIPCNRADVSEALSLHMPRMSPETQAKRRAEMEAVGYDFDHPRIDDKFLAWMHRIS